MTTRLPRADHEAQWTLRTDDGRDGQEIGDCRKKGEYEDGEGSEGGFSTTGGGRDGGDGRGFGIGRARADRGQEPYSKVVIESSPCRCSDLLLLDNVPLELVGKVARAGAVAEPGHVESGAVARHGGDGRCRARFAVAVDDDRWQA